MRQGKPNTEKKGGAAANALVTGKERGEGRGKKRG